MIGDASWWWYVALAALIGGGVGIVLRLFLRDFIAWLDLRVLPARHLKKCGVRRRASDQQ
jgi:hypothetical protein